MDRFSQQESRRAMGAAGSFDGILAVSLRRCNTSGTEPSRGVTSVGKDKAGDESGGPMANDLKDSKLLERSGDGATALGADVGLGTQRPAAGNADAMSATKESLADYTLRFAPRSYRKWSAGVVATSALGGIAYLADFSIGANIGIAYGTVNAILGIIVAAVIIFATGFPLAYYAARYNIDLDLITRGSGFGYYGSIVTNVIFATFTFIFFALEGSIMAQGLELGLGIPQWLGYAASTIIIIPLVIYGMNTLAKLQVWTTPLWLLLMVAPFVYLVVSHPESVGQFFAYQGENGKGGFDLGSTLLAAGVCLSLIAQIAEQNDYLRFMPPRTPENKRSWWTWLILAGPGWVFFGAIKQIVGLFLAVYLIANVANSAGIANQPVHQFLEIYENFLPGWLAMTLAVC